MGSWRRRGRGGLIGSPARPWGQREGPRPARGAARPSSPGLSPPLPSRVPGQGMSCSRRSLPGARGQGGLGCVLPSSPHLLPPRCEPAATTAAAPDSRRPRAGAAQGVGQGEGLGVPCGERASWRHLVAVPRAGERPQWPLGFVTSTTQLGCWPPCQGGRWESGLRSCGEGVLSPELPQPGSLQIREHNPLPLLGSNPPPSVHSLFCWSPWNLVSDF